MKSQYIIIFITFIIFLIVVQTMLFDSFNDNANAKTMHKVFEGLYSDMQRAHVGCDSVQLEPTVQSVNSNSLRLLPLPSDIRNQVLSSHSQSYSGKYFPKNIQDYILHEESVAITYRFSTTDGGRSVVLHFVVYDEPNPDLKKMLKRARRVCALMHLVSLHASRATCSATLNIYIYMTHFKKLFPGEKGEAFDTEHANTGMAYHCAKANDIVVYRKEEWFKVLIHESFHAFGLSFIESDMEDGVDAAMQRVLQRTYAISHPVRVYETYCEIWARILNVVFACFSPLDSNRSSSSSSSSSSNRTNPKDPISTVKFNAFSECVMNGLHKDARHALEQSAKVMHHMGIPHRVLLNPTKENQAVVAEKYRENTNVFAYYVMTCALQHSPHVFLTWCHKNNPKGKILQFRTIPSNFNGFMEMLLVCKHQCPVPLDMTPTVSSGTSMRMTMAPNE
jgi:hypothetical protein